MNDSLATTLLFVLKLAKTKLSLFDHYYIAFKFKLKHLFYQHWFE
jgi:hypothetical protein